MEGRIHLRALDDCLKRVVVYFRDNVFALATEQTLPSFQADGLAKLSDADRARVAERDDETARRFDQTAQDAKPPLLITKNPAYKGPIVGSLDPFRIWVYSQVEHCTPIALAEISNRLSTYSEQTYNTDDGAQMLVAAVGMGLNITAHLAALGVAVTDEYREMEARFAEVLERSGLAGPPEECE
jgi:hypothetical protein